MKSNNNITNLFKDFLKIKNSYKGGESIALNVIGQKTYKLSSNENPIGTSPKAISAIERQLQNLHIYPDATDIRLREALFDYYDHHINVDQFIGANSGAEIISLIIMGFVSERDEVIISSPCFVLYKMVSRWAGADIKDIPLKKSTYELDVIGIINAITTKTKIIFLSSPNNPTGTYIPKETLEHLLKKIPSNIVVIFDEVYWHFTDADDYVTAKSYISKYKNLIAVNTFSKAYGLASLRVGYAYMDIEVANYLRQLCRPFLISKLSLEASIAVLQDTSFIKKTINLIKTERAFISEQFNDLKIKFWPTQANFFLIDPPISDKEFVAFLSREGIITRLVENFGAPGKVRISIGNKEANLALLKALKKLLETIGFDGTSSVYTI